MPGRFLCPVNITTTTTMSSPTITAATTAPALSYATLYLYEAVAISEAATRAFERASDCARRAATARIKSLAAACAAPQASSSPTLDDLMPSRVAAARAARRADASRQLTLEDRARQAQQLAAAAAADAAHAAEAAREAWAKYHVYAAR